MEDVVAVEVVLDSGQLRYFMTWGRVLDAVDEGPLMTLVLEHAPKFGLGGTPVAAKVCPSLAAAKEEPFFFEGLLHFAQRPIPFGDGYESWRQGQAASMRDGRELYFLGVR